ncbi:MAG: inner membrane-spanning protein YciB [Pseudomonadota bacterium]
MSDTEQARAEAAPGEKSQNARTLGQGSKLLVDIGPAAVFMVSYNVARRMAEDQAIYWATGLFMASVALAVAYSLIVQKRFPPMLAVTFVIVTLFGGMTLYLQDPIFVYIKPTLINLIFGFAILFSFAFGFNVWKALFGSIFEMPERAWTMLAIRWALFFLALAFMNEVLWRHITDTTVDPAMRWFEGFTITESFWVNFRFWGVYPIFFLFAAANIPLTLKYAKEPGGGKETAKA